MRRTLLEIADDLRAIATTGAHYTDSHYDRERYAKLFELASRLASVVEDRPVEEMRELYTSADRAYVTPKLDVRMTVLRDDAVLLVQERQDQLWALPGGWIDVGDSPSEAAERETLEEAGLQVRAERLVGVFDYRLQPQAPPALFHIHKLIFVGRLTADSSEPRPGPDVLDARFFPLSALPPLSLGRTLPLHIETARRIALDPTRPAHFD